MSLDMSARARIERVLPALASRSADEIARAVDAPGPSAFRDELLGLGREGRFSAFYAPFDWINDQADVVIVGVTPGRRQAKDALLALRSAAMRGYRSTRPPRPQKHKRRSPACVNSAPV